MTVTELRDLLADLDGNLTVMIVIDPDTGDAVHLSNDIGDEPNEHNAVYLWPVAGKASF